MTHVKLIHGLHQNRPYRIANEVCQCDSICVLEDIVRGKSRPKDEGFNRMDKVSAQVSKSDPLKAFKIALLC